MAINELRQHFARVDETMRIAVQEEAARADRLQAERALFIEMAAETDDRLIYNDQLIVVLQAMIAETRFHNAKIVFSEGQIFPSTEKIEFMIGKNRERWVIQIVPIDHGFVVYYHCVDKALNN